MKTPTHIVAPPILLAARPADGGSSPSFSEAPMKERRKEREREGGQAYPGSHSPLTQVGTQCCWQSQQ